jgi:dipeptidyl aminopeptidase/acylaminoacyl peptidase
MKTRLAAAFAALAALAAALAGAANAKAPLTAEAMWQIQRLARPDLSPDGRWAALAVTAPDVKQDTLPSDIWLVPTAGGEARRLTTHAASDANPVWSPDGQWIAFESKRDDDENTQVYVISTAGGEARRLTNMPTGASVAKWFPDSKRLAFVSRVWTDLSSWEDMATRQKERKDSKVSARVWDAARVRYWDRWLDEREAHVYTIGLEGGEPKPVTLGTGRQLAATEVGPGSYDVSPDGKEIAFAADSDTTGIDANFDVFVVPAEGGEARNLTPDNPAADASPLYSPDGRYLAFLRQTIKGFYADRTRLVLHERGTGRNRVLTEEWDRSVSGLVWAADGRALYGAIDDAGTRRVYRIDAATGGAAPLTRDHSFSALARSASGDVLVALRESFLEPPTLVRVDLRTGAATKLSAFNDALIETLELGRYESLTYQGADGAEIQMWVSYPPGFDRQKRYPLYLLIHGGPHSGITDGFHWRWNAQVMSAWGYVTAWPNFHGSSGFGQAFTDSINPDWAEKPYRDVIAAARHLAEQPFIDPERLAAGGGSYGGYLASVILGREHPFRTLVAHAAVYNLYTQYGADYGATRRRHGEFWAQPESYQRNSPHYAAGSFTTPTLVIHGARDYRVPDNHGLELFNTLQNRGVRSRLVHYPDENHWILKPQNSLHWYGSVRDWLEEHVGAGAR